jgi:hypothetical protein
MRMKARWHLPCLCSLLSCAALLLFAGCATEPKGGATKPLPAHVVRLQGEVRWARDISLPWEQAKLWVRLPEGAVIETGPKSQVVVWFGQVPSSLRHPRYVSPEFRTNAAVRLWENSHLRLDRLVQERSSGSKDSMDLRFNLSTGHMLGRVPKLDPGSTYDVQFGSCVARLTNGPSLYDVTAEGRIRVEGGAASVRWPSSAGTLTVNSGQQLDPRTNVLQRIAVDTSHWWHYLP